MYLHVLVYTYIAEEKSFFVDETFSNFQNFFQTMSYYRWVQKNVILSLGTKKILILISTEFDTTQGHSFAKNISYRPKLIVFSLYTCPYCYREKSRDILPSDNMTFFLYPAIMWQCLKKILKIWKSFIDKKTFFLCNIGIN